MAILLDEYNEWNNPVVGAYLLWRFSSGYEKAHAEHRAPSVLLHCIAMALLRGRVYSDAIEHAHSLHAYAANFVRSGYADKLESLHGKVQSHLPYTLRSIDMAISRSMVALDVEDATLAPLGIGQQKRGTGALSRSVRKLGNKAATLGKWMAPLELSTIAIDLGVKF